MKGLTVRVVLVLAAAFLAWLLFWPVPIEPRAWKAPPAPKLEGPYAPNDALAGVEWLGRAADSSGATGEARHVADHAGR